MRQMRSSFTIAAALTVALLGAGVSRAVVSAQGKTTWSGVFTAQQVESGKALAAAKCGSCHGTTLKGELAPALVGADFIDHWYDARLGELAGLAQGRRASFEPPDHRDEPDVGPDEHCALGPAHRAVPGQCGGEHAGRESNHASQHERDHRLGDHARRGDCGDVGALLPRHRLLLRLGVDRAQHRLVERGEEIGRASCRERV